MRRCQMSALADLEEDIRAITLRPGESSSRTAKVIVHVRSSSGRMYSADELYLRLLKHGRVHQAILLAWHLCVDYFQAIPAI